jgi:hypothetical protein
MAQSKGSAPPGAGPSQTSIAQKTQIAKTFDGERFEQKFTTLYNYRSPW